MMLRVIRAFLTAALVLTSFNLTSASNAAGTPSLVTGLKIASIDVSKKTLTFSWNKNPASDQVDLYALYYYDPSGGVWPSEAHIGVFAAATKNTSITTKVDGLGDADFLYTPYGVNELPISLPSNDNSSIPTIKIWVIAHNKNGWGRNDTNTANPDVSPADFLPDQADNSTIKGGPTVVDVDFSTLDPRFMTGTFPNFSHSANMSDLTNTPPKNSPWVVPWKPEVDLPLSRFQPGRPSDIKNLKIIKLDLKKNLLVLSWSPSPAFEKVDKYAVYVQRRGTCAADYCPIEFLGVQQKTLYQATILPGGGDLNTETNKPNSIRLYKGEDVEFWVIAHNQRGWGNNDPDTGNPDQSDWGPVAETKNQIKKYPKPAYSLYVTVP